MYHDKAFPGLWPHLPLVCRNCSIFGYCNVSLDISPPIYPLMPCDLCCATIVGRRQEAALLVQRTITNTMRSKYSLCTYHRRAGT